MGGGGCYVGCQYRQFLLNLSGRVKDLDIVGGLNHPCIDVVLKLLPFSIGDCVGGSLLEDWDWDGHLIEDGVVQVDDGEVADDETDSSWNDGQSPATVLVVPVNPDVSGWVVGVAEGNLDCVWVCKDVTQGFIVVFEW